MSGVSCQVSGVRRQVLGVRCQVLGIRCQVSVVACQVSCVRFFFIFLDRLESLLSTGPTPSSFNRPGVAGAVLHTASLLIN